MTRLKSPNIGQSRNLAAKDIQPGKSMVEFPKVDNPYFGMLMVCCHLRTRSTSVRRKLRALPASGSPLLAKIRTKPATYAMAFGDGPEEKDSVHFHVNIIRPDPDHYDPADMPKINRTTSEMSETIAEFVGQDAYVSLRGIFFVPVSKIPKDDTALVGMSLSEDKMGPISIRQTAGRISVDKGAKLTWTLRNDERELRIEIHVHGPDKIDEKYLVTSYKRIANEFHGLVGV